MKKFVKINIILLIVLFIISLINISYAASFSVNSSTSSVVKGKTFTITINGGSVIGRFNISSTSNISLSQTSVWVENNTLSITGTANSTGSGTVTVVASNVSDNEGNDVTGSRTVSVNITEPSAPVIPGNTGGGSTSSGGNTTSGGSTTKPKTTNNNSSKEVEKSKDTSLKGLTVAEGAISPEFNKDIKEYTLSVPNEITEINAAITVNDTKSTFSISKNKDLQVGENIVTIEVKAEDGTTTNYIIKVTRAREELALQTLTIKYINENGEIIDLLLKPEFKFDVYEYTLEELEHTIAKLKVEALANLENVIIEIQGNENIVEGENVITITVKIPLEVVEGEEPQEEIKTYTIKVNRKAEPIPPTLMGRISDWFKGITGTIGVWYNENLEQIIIGSLSFCAGAMLILSVFIIKDYKKYKLLLEKVKRLDQTENIEKVVNVAEVNINEDVKQEPEDIIETKNNNAQKSGKHF